MDQKNGMHQNVKALLYFAVMSVFLRASLAGPTNINLNSQHNINYETLVGEQLTTTSKSSFIPSLELAEIGVEFDRVAGLVSMDNSVF
ncbi:8705_t:CDS:1, partial [Funneliformis geosporum]